MNTPDPTADLSAQLMPLVRALHQICPNRFLANIVHATTLREWYGAVLELNYAANSKELRDTGDQQVHALCEQIREEVRQIDNVFRDHLYPSSPGQKQSWEASVFRSPGGKYTFRDDGSLIISVLDSRIDGDKLHVKRVWNHVCNFDGSLEDFWIRLESDQASSIRAKQSLLRRAQMVVIGAGLQRSR